MTLALSLQDVCVRFGDRVALNGLSLDVDRGEAVALLGPNGSGKSTTLSVAAGALEPHSGTVRAVDLCRSDDPAGFAARIGFVPQSCALYDEFTCLDNLRFFGRLYGLGGRDLGRRVKRSLARVGLAERAGQRVGTLSGGLRQRANLAAALLHDPPVLLLDEPTASLDAAARDELLDDLNRLRDDGHAILFSTHQLDDVDAACDRVVLLDAGNVVASGDPGAIFSSTHSGRSILYAHLARRPPRFVERALQERLGSKVDLEITGRRLRLAAGTQEELGRALAVLLAGGVEAESFRTPQAAIERVLAQRTAADSTGAAA
jgi:ABC-2 type transport system ATP-binding protein